MSRYKQPYALIKRGKYWYYRTYDARGIRTTAKSTGQTSKAAARSYCDNLFLSGGLNQTNKTFYEYAFHFYDDDAPYVRDRVEPLTENTLLNMRNKMKNYLLPYFGKLKLSNITYTTLKEFRIYMLKNYSVSNVISTISCLKHIFDAAFRDRLITVNPFEYLEPMAARANERDAFTLEEVQTLYNEIGEEFKNSILLMALTGTRISEAVGLRPTDFVESNGFIYIDLKEQYNHKKYKILKGKNARPIPVIPEVRELIGFDDTRLSAFYKAFVAIKDRFREAEARNLSFHSLRHFFFTSAISYGIPEIKVKRIVGHSLKGMTNVYLNLKAEDLTEVLAWQNKTIEEIKKGSAPSRENANP